MKGSAWAKTLPDSDIPAREAMILQAVVDGHFVVDWTPIVTQSGGINALFVVSADVLKIGEPGDAIRVNCSQKLSQMIADHLGCVLPTAKLSDEIWKQADLKLEPMPKPWYSSPKGCTVGCGDGTMGLTRRMIDFDGIVTSQIAGRAFNLVAGHHKDWINSRLLGTEMGKWTTPKQEPNAPAACNYGWHTKAAGASGRSQTIPGIRVYQPAAIAHSWNHSDYSQMLRLVQRHVYLCAPSAVSGFGAEGTATPYGKPGDPCVLSDGTTGSYSLLDIMNMPSMGGDITKLMSGEGFLLMRHPAMTGAVAEPPPKCMSFVPGACPSGGGGGQQVQPPLPVAEVDYGKERSKALLSLAAGGGAGYLLVRAIPWALDKLGRRT